MVKLQVCIPHKAVFAVQVTGVIPTPQNVPGGGTQTTVPKPHGKLMEGTAKLTIAPQLFGAQFCTTLEGQLIPPVLGAVFEPPSSAHSGPTKRERIITAKINAFLLHRLRIWTSSSSNKWWHLKATKNLAFLERPSAKTYPLRGKCEENHLLLASFIWPALVFFLSRKEKKTELRPHISRPLFFLELLLATNCWGRYLATKVPRDFFC